jgi:hypothetical protein
LFLEPDLDMTGNRLARRDVFRLSACAGLSLALPRGSSAIAEDSDRREPHGPDEDWAFVVGIQDYPGFVDRLKPRLQGPVNDALAFYQWVTACPPVGPGVPKENAKLIVQTCARTRPPSTPFPSQHDIEHEFQTYWKLAQANKAQMLGEKAGHRLYLYLAGHGIDLAGSAGPGLFTADAGPGKRVRHIPGKCYADWFYRAAYFDEVLLFMDCCRDYSPLTAARTLPWDEKVCSNPDGKYFYGFGTKWNKPARERAFDGKVHGVFTKALLEGLKGDASDPVTNLVTAASLARYLQDNMTTFLGPLLDGLPDENCNPETLYEPQTADGFVIVEAPATLHPVSIRLSAEARRGKVRICLSAGTEFKVYYNQIPTSDTIQLQLPRGLYVAWFGSAKCLPFQVPCGTDVSL